MATLQTHFRGRGGLIQNLAIEAEFLHHFFCASLPFGQSRFVAKNLIFSRPDFFAKKTGSPSFVSFSCLSCSHTVDHHYYLSQIECKDISFFFLRPIQHAANSSRTTFSATFCPNLSRNPFNFTVPPSCRGYCVELFFPLEYPRPNFTSKKIHTTLFSLGWPRG